MQKTTVYLDRDGLPRLETDRRKDSPAAGGARPRGRGGVCRPTRRATAPKSIGAFSSGRHDLSERAEDLLKGMGRSR